jgi:hypothetical protein
MNNLVRLGSASLSQHRLLFFGGSLDMKRNIRAYVIAATMALAAVPMLTGCVVVPAYHGYWHGHWHR